VDDGAAVCREPGIVSDKTQRFGQRLGQQDPVERIAMQVGQALQRQCVLWRDRR